ncbi:MAG: hypothetical protein KGL39_20300 [Patescibacteria group bacterium]|nr:hypothetical protein [Patescibacteria group bacterium]
MPLTNFPFGVSSFGIPVLGGASIPFTGNYWFVKPNSGLDGNSGNSPQTALKTVSHALSLATANNNDVIFLISESNTASATTDYQSATLTWNKDLTHLIGICAPTQFSQRARIAQTSTATAVSPLVNITANGCYFANFSVFQGVADATSLVAVQVTGQRNVFDNVTMAGIGDATMVAAGAASLKIAAGAENIFRNCTIGQDTISIDQNCTVLWCTSSATRNTFDNCVFDAYISNAGAATVTIGTNGIDRTLSFKDCQFWAKSTNKAVTQTSVFSIPAISQGAIVLDNSTFFTDGGTGGVWDSNTRGIIWNNTAAAAASGAGGEMTNL